MLPGRGQSWGAGLGGEPQSSFYTISMIRYDLAAMEPALSPPRRPRKPSENRDKLIAVAHELMASRGFAGTSTEAIVRAAGITRGALYYQFLDKQDLFRAVCDALVTRLATQIWTDTMAEVERAGGPWDG